jgi:predicted dinucleotide-binding enzyme
MGAPDGALGVNSVNIAVIGGGSVGGTLGRLWAANGHQIVFGVPDPAASKYQELIRAAGPNARAATVPQAASFGDVVVLATPWPATKSAIESAGSLARKIVIDATNPLAADLSALTIGTNNSAGEEVARWAVGANVVKAFNTIGAVNFDNPRFGSETASMFICGDDAGAKSTVGALAAQLGFEVVDAGPLTAARTLEPMALLWIQLAYQQGMGPNHALRLARR